MDLLEFEEEEKVGRGYIGYSKSINALEAEERGLFPASTIARLTKTSADFVKEKFVPREWHHTSKHFNKTFYYCLQEVKDFLQNNPHAYKAWKEERESKKVARIASRVIFYDWTFGYPEEIELNDIMVEFNGKQSYSFEYKGKKITKRRETKGFYICWKPTEEEIQRQKEEEERIESLYIKAPDYVAQKIQRWQFYKKFWIAMKDGQIVDAICMRYDGDDFEKYREESRKYLAQKGDVFSAVHCHSTKRGHSFVKLS